LSGCRPYKILVPNRACFFKKQEMKQHIDYPKTVPGAEKVMPVLRFALWNLGFRPFYLFASIFGAFSILLWACQYAGYLPAAYLKGATWHGHEMLFGYTLAVVAGFLFTAVRAWTGQSTPTGPALAGFALLWAAGRLLVLTPYESAAALVNAAFPVAVAIGIAIPLARSSNRRNYFLVPLQLLLGLAALAFHLSYLNLIAWPQRAGLQFALDLVVFILVVISGRVVPMFTNNGIPGAQATRNVAVENIALVSVLFLLGADVLQAPSRVIAVLAVAAVCSHAVRIFLWQPWRTLGTPLVWILHAAYGWIIVYFMLRALAALGLIAESLAVHALTVGAIGGMTIGMMTRTALGHTGRPLVAGTSEVACFILIQLAALIRVLGGMFVPEAYLSAVIVSGFLWSAAFAIYAVCYWPVLSRPRIDGKPG
jgi:uncharacterized protein involved in response to NO